MATALRSRTASAKVAQSLYERGAEQVKEITGHQERGGERQPGI
jgi:hypothetical protein